MKYILLQGLLGTFSFFYMCVLPCYNYLSDYKKTVRTSDGFLLVG